MKQEELSFWSQVTLNTKGKNTLFFGFQKQLMSGQTFFMFWGLKGCPPTPCGEYVLDSIEKKTNCPIPSSFTLVLVLVINNLHCCNLGSP